MVSAVVFVATSSSCSRELKKPPKKSEVDAPPVGDTPPTVGNDPTDTDDDDTKDKPSPASPVITMKECNDKGLVWIAATDDGDTKCGEPLAAWECCKLQVLMRFPTVRSAMETFFSKREEEEKVLYNCGKVGENNYWIHFVKDDGAGSVDYTALQVTAQEVDPGTAASCP